MSITEKIGNGAASRKEVYELIQDVIGHDLPEAIRKKIKNIMLDYAVRVQDDGIQRMQQLAMENTVLSQKIQMLQTGSHHICQRCGQVRKK